MRRQIELEADRIEEVLAVHNAPGRVTGGTVTPRWVRFDVAPARSTKVNAIKHLADDLAAALDVANVRVARRGATLAVEVPRDDAQPVKLTALLQQLDHIPPVTATLGLADDGAPLLARLPSPDVAHVLVSGTTGSGKTVLLRAITLSLALRHSQPRELALVLIDPRGGSAFRPLRTLPQLVRPVVTKAEDAAHVLASLAALMDHRDQQHAANPPIVVIIDELADLLMTADGATEQMTRLVQRGRGAGIHVVAATQKPTAAVLGPLVKANFPVRIVGKVTSSTDARVASGWAGTGAERLQGRGDFVVVAEGRLMRFQGAFISRQEIGEVLRSQGWDSIVEASEALTERVQVVSLPEPPEPEPDPVDKHFERLRQMDWDPARSYRAACRALGEAEGGGPFSQVKAAVDRLRVATTATTTAEKPDLPTGKRRDSLASGSSSSPWLHYLERGGTL